MGGFVRSRLWRLRRVAGGLVAALALLAAAGPASAEVRTFLDARTGVQPASVDVSHLDAFGCAVLPSGEIDCWGSLEAVTGGIPAGPWKAVAAGAHACAIAADSALTCWGNGLAATSEPAGRFVAVAGGLNCSCAIGTAGALACWGAGGAGQATPPAGKFLAVAAGDDFAERSRDGGARASEAGPAASLEAL